jgi:two-component system, OmpR family, response regulator
MGARLLLVEDDSALAAGLVRGLKQHGFEVELLATGADAARAALAGKHDLVVLDLMLPEQDGFAVLEQLQHRSSPPVIVLTARTGLEDRLASFRLGAADYLGKPFWIEELLARIRARLGLDVVEPSRVLRFGALTLDLDARKVTVDGAQVKLTRTELDVLVYLAQRPGRAVPRGQLAEHVLPSLEEGDARTVDAHVTRIRKKLGPAGARVATVWGIGYRFEPEDPA